MPAPMEHPRILLQLERLPNLHQKYDVVGEIARTEVYLPIFTNSSDT